MLLEVEDLGVRYGGVVALHGVSLSVDEGEAVAVLGPNGAGKTSLARTVSGQVRPAKGRITLSGRSLRGRRPYHVARLGLAQVPEGRAIVAPLTVEENLLMGGYLLDSRTLKVRLEEMLQLFPVLGQRLGVRAGLLSGGEQQMLSIARALVSGPKLLVVDEPSMGLAPVVVDDVLDALRAVVAQGASILLLEQNASLALDVTTRAAVLVRGEIVASGPTAELGEGLLATYLN